MLTKLINKVKEGIKKANQEEVVNTSKFKDPLASKVSWKPLKKGGANFQTHKFIKQNKDVIVVKPTIGAQIFTHIFLIVAGGALAYFAYSSYESGEIFHEENLISLGIGLVFSLAAFFLHKNMGQNKYFNKSEGYYWVGKKEPKEVYNPTEHPEFTKLSTIHSLQLLKEFVSTDDSSYYSYELNLVLNDLTRINVTDHKNITSLREDAVMLSQFLKIRLWDGTNG